MKPLVSIAILFATVAHFGEANEKSPLASIQPGTARNIGPWTAGDTVDAPGQRTDYSSSAYDPVGKRILLRGGHHGLNNSTNIRALDLRTLKFSNLMPDTPKTEMVTSNSDATLGRWISTNQPWARHTYNGNVVVNGRFWMMAAQNSHNDMNGQSIPPGDGRIASYDLSATDYKKGWRYSKVSSQTRETNWCMLIAACAVRGKILVVRVLNGWSEGYLYDPEADAVSKLPLAMGAWKSDPCVVYCPANGRCYAIAETGSVFEIDLDEKTPNKTKFAKVCDVWGAGIDTITRDGKSMGVRLSRVDYDPVNRVLGGSLHGGGKGDHNDLPTPSFVTFDPATRKWTQHAVAVEAGSAGVPGTSFWAGSFDQESGCYISFHANGACWAYRPPMLTRTPERRER